MYTFSSPPTVIEAPRVRVTPATSVDVTKKLLLEPPVLPTDKNLSVTDDSGTECELDRIQMTSASVSPTGPGSCSIDCENLLGATKGQTSPMRQSVLRSSLREIPEDELRRSGVSNVRTVCHKSDWISCT